MMKKRMTAGMLATLMAAVLPVSACAAQNSAPQPQLNTAEHMQYMNGYTDGTFRPDKNVTRAELMAMINRATGRTPKSADAFLPGMKTWSDNTADKWYYLDVQEATNSHAYSDKSKDDKYEKWTTIRDARDWTELEK